MDSKDGALLRIIYKGNEKAYEALFLIKQANSITLIKFSEFTAGN